MKKTIFMDYQSTTPVDKRVVDAMVPYFTEVYGNPSSRNHQFGWDAEDAVKASRETVATAIGAKESEIIFTSGATESNNLAIFGVAEMYREKGNHIITCATEHNAVLDPCETLEKRGYKVTRLIPQADGIIDLSDLEKAITSETILVSIMYVNNEIGVIQPIAEIGKICRARGVLFHTDATQAVGKIPVCVEKDSIDLLSMSSHKFYGPKGVGALYVRRRNPRVRLSPLVHGGGQERGMRSGTLNVPGIVGMAKALELCLQEMPEETVRLNNLRNRFEIQVMGALDYCFINGNRDRRIAGNTNISFAYVEGEGLMMAMPEIAVSSGSACTSSSLEPSHVLKALGVKDELAHSSIRFGFGRFSTEEEVDFAASKVVLAVKRLRELSPLYEMVMEGIDLSTVKWTDHH